MRKKQMRYLLGVTLMAAVSMTACSSNKTQEQPQALEQQISRGDSSSELSVMDQYKELLNSALSVDEITEFVDNNIANVSQEEADTMTRGLIGYTGNPKSFDYKKISEYKKYLSDDMNSFVNLFIVEQEQPYKDENGIAITLSDLLNRALNTEQFLAKYQSSAFYDHAYNYYCELMEAAITGGYIEGTNEVNFYFNQEQDKIDGHAVDIYSAFVKEHQNSVTAQILKEYLKVLVESNNRMDAMVLKTYRNLFETIREFLNK